MTVARDKLRHLDLRIGVLSIGGSTVFVKVDTCLASFNLVILFTSLRILAGLFWHILAG